MLALSTLYKMTKKKIKVGYCSSSSLIHNSVFPKLLEFLLINKKVLVIIIYGVQHSHEEEFYYKLF